MTPPVNNCKRMSAPGSAVVHATFRIYFSEDAWSEPGTFCGRRTIGWQHLPSDTPATCLRCLITVPGAGRAK